MLRKFALLPMLLFAIYTKAQTKQIISDSIDFYSSRLSALQQQLADSIPVSKRFHRRYLGFTFFYTLTGADYKNINRTTAPYGFSPFRGSINGMGIGYSYMSNKGLVLEANFLMASFNNSSTHGAESIQSGFSNLFQADLGYAVFSNRHFNIYPYLGLSLRRTDLYFIRPGYRDTTYNAIVGVNETHGGITASSYALGYQAGACFEWMVSRSPGRLFGATLFTKLGTDGIFGRDCYKIQTVNYDPGIKYGAWAIAIGIKILM